MAVDDLSYRHKRAAAGLKVSAYDRSSSLLIAMLLIVTAAVIGVVIIFFSSRLKRTPPAIPVTPIESSLEEIEGDLEDEMPGVENAPEEAIQDLEEMLEQVNLAAADDSVLMADQGAVDASSARRGDPRGTGTGRRARGKMPRREIRFEPQSMQQYAAWFDGAGLEIGVLGEDNLVYLATNLSQPTPDVRTSTRDEANRRLYFNSMGGPLYPLDRQLARKAGILDKGELVLQFCKPPTQTRLLQLEAEAADGKPRQDIMRTVYGVVEGQGGRYDFEVKEQQYYR